MFTTGKDSVDCSLEDSMKAMKLAADHLQRDESIDYLVLTTRRYEQLRAEVEEKLYEPHEIPLSGLSVMGVPVEHYDTEEEVLLRCQELRDCGRKVGYCL
jgi:hypothetical protein